MSDLDDVIVSECESCNTRSKAVNSDNGYETPLCPKCIEIWDSEHEDDGLSECEACGVRVDALYTVWDIILCAKTALIITMALRKTLVE